MSAELKWKYIKAQKSCQFRPTCPFRMANCFGSLSSSSGANVVREGVSSWAKLFCHTETHKSQTKGKGPISSFLFKGRQSWYPNDREGRRSRIGTIAIRKAPSQHALVLVQTSAMELGSEACTEKVHQLRNRQNNLTHIQCSDANPAKNAFYLIS